ncbi:hypothetical protein HU200_001125 [Digitaria exilis]|uniref:Alpha/beta hydrolase fold-3 domain-containing protein n=1 Tax=Digitaria exilis TaxID=1010633 RepID=A0A835FZN2_9POAL|nr:hypothetical protein HU200_001125 [Digitaria exilis]
MLWSDQKVLERDMIYATLVRAPDFVYAIDSSDLAGVTSNFNCFSVSKTSFVSLEACKCLFYHQGRTDTFLHGHRSRRRRGGLRVPSALPHLQERKDRAPEPASGAPRRPRRGHRSHLQGRPDAQTGLSARLYLPKLQDPSKKLPVLVYYHGGAFLLESADSATYHTYVNPLAAAAGVLVVSVSYRLAPEHPLPAAYEDSWAALRWAVSAQDDWIAEHGDLGRLFLAGDSAGANIVHDMLLRVSGNGGSPRVEGAVMLHPWFGVNTPIEGEPEGATAATAGLWTYACPGAVRGADDPRMNPLAPGAPPLEKLACARKKDALYVRDRAYYEAVAASAWPGEVSWLESEGEEHVFFLGKPECENAKKLMERVHPLPASYDDCWAALRWASSAQDTWIAEHADVSRVFVAGDSAGGNIVHNVLMRASSSCSEDAARIEGAVMLHPFFGGSTAIEGEPERAVAITEKVWAFACPDAAEGADDPRINPTAPGAPGLDGLGCERVMVCAAEKDWLVPRNRAYYDAVVASAWPGSAAWVETEGEEHVFFLHKPDCDRAKALMDHVLAFIAGT